MQSGTLSLGDGSTHTNLADSAAVRVSHGATLHLNYSGTDTVDALSFGGIARPPGVYSGANSSFLTGSGTLTVSTGPATDFDGWAAFHNLTGGQNDDDDYDGMSNRSEYAFGTDPKNGASAQPVTGIPALSAGTLTYTRRSTSLSGLSFTIWTSTNLTHWTEDTGAVQSVTGTTGDVETVDVTLTEPLLENDRLFIQVRAQ